MVKKMIGLRRIVVVPFLLTAGQAWAEQNLAGDVAAGEKVARSSCGECHELGKHPIKFGFAPAFAKIANTKGMTQTSIEVFLSTPHEVMANYVLSPNQIRDVAAYIMELRSGDGKGSRL
jgi:mono/diheme cytochrome c family protein